MAEHLTLARPYAKAAFEYALDAGQLDQWRNMLATLAAVAEQETVQAWLSNPAHTRAQVVDTLADIAGEAMAKGGKGFLSQLAEYKRIALLPEVFQLFGQWLLQHQERADVLIQSAFALTVEQEASITAAMKKRLGKDISVQTEIDESLIGGVRIQAGDLVIDDSIKARLNRLTDSLQA